jgi:hypothetical protein
VRSYRERMSFKPEEVDELEGDRLDAARGMIFVTLAGLALCVYAIWWLW